MQTKAAGSRSATPDAQHKVEVVETVWARRHRDAGAPGTAPRCATSPTTTDLQALHGGRDRLLTVREAADQLHLGTWAIYRFCETGELPHIRIIDSIRIRPADLAAFTAARRVATSGKRPAREG